MSDNTIAKKIMNRSRGEYQITDNKITDINTLISSNLEQNKVIYEVIKLIDSVPLFLSQHHDRMQLSASQSGIALMTTESEMVKNIELLSKTNQITTGNIEISATKKHITYRFIPHFYPTTEMYNAGVSVDYYYAERQSPNAKVKNNTLRNKINKFLKKNRLYEAILVSHQGEITEGSRSNILFIDKKNRIITPPESQILKGITRQETLKICTRQEIEIIEKNISKSELKEFDSAFITGTSPGVIPVKNIHNIRYNINNKILRSIMAEFRKIETNNHKP